MPSAKALDKKALWKDIEQGARKKRRTLLAELRERLRAARAERKDAIARAKATCRDARKAAVDRAKTLEAEAKAERARARSTCSAGAESADRAREGVKASKDALEGERRFQREMRQIEASSRARKKEERASAKTRRDESDDEVRANLPPDLVPLFEKVKRGIKGSARISRTEAFLQYAEEHPAEMFDIVEDQTAALIRELEARERELAEEYERGERLAVANPAGELVELGKLTRLAFRDEASGRARVLRWGLRKAPILAYAAAGKRANAIIVYPVAVRGRASAASSREYARTHWGRSGAGERVEGLRALSPLRPLGPLTAVTYTTEKGGDESPTDYEHDAGEGAAGEWTAPTVFEHACTAPKCAYRGMVCLSGGTYRVTDRGIVG